MARVFVSPEARDGDVFVVEGESFRHAVDVLRTRAGDRLRIFDGSGFEFVCVAERVTPRRVTARIVEVCPLRGEISLSLRLFCALLKGDKLDLVLQKGTEIGVERFGLFQSERCAVRIAAHDEAARRGRWQRIVQAAVGQCGRPTVPLVEGPLPLDAMLEVAASADVALMPWEGDGTESLPRLSEVLAARGAVRSVALVIGPEGGFTRSEIASARARGLAAVTLGTRILRAETAALVAPALVLAATGELG